MIKHDDRFYADDETCVNEFLEMVGKEYLVAIREKGEIVAFARKERAEGLVFLMNDSDRIFHKRLKKHT